MHRGKLQRDLLATTADHDWNGIANRRRQFLSHALLDDRQRLAQVAQSAGGSAEFIAKLDIIFLKPARADAKDQSAAADVIDRICHLRQQRRVAIAVASHQRADLSAGRQHRDRRQQRPAFKVLPIAIAI